MYIDVPHPNPKESGKLLLRFDPDRDLIQIQDRGKKFVIDLAELRDQSATARPPAKPHERIDSE